MLKLEDFKVKELETLETITGGETESGVATYRTINILGWLIVTDSKSDSCSSCD